MKTDSSINNKHTTRSGGKVIIIGGGIAGLCSAYYLLRSGWEVTLLDKGDLYDSCSLGNAGLIVPSHFIPLAAPGIVKQGIKWMFSNSSPFYLKPSLNPSLISWGIKFLRHANTKHAEKSAPYLRDINLLSRGLYQELATDLKGDFGLTNKGVLMLYKTERAAEEEYALAQKARELGLDVATLDRAEVQRLEPEVTLDVLGANHYRCDSHLFPPSLIELLINRITDLGARLLTHTEVTELREANGTIAAVVTNEEEFKPDKIVVTGGAWLQKILKTTNIHIPIMPGKGYSFFTHAFNNKVKHPALLLEARVALTPMGGKVRIGGTMELAAMNHKISLNRVRGIVQSVPQYYPEYQLPIPDMKEIWYGFRPCSPDGLPYLGRSNKFNNLLIAGGLSMMGLSLGPAVGKIISELANEAQPSSDISHFHPERFN